MDIYKGKHFIKFNFHVLVMNILIIGGSRFVGPYIIEKLLKKGHKVTVFNRGQLPLKHAKKLTIINGDRNKGFTINMRFDVVIDTCAYTGIQVEQAIKQLHFDFFIHFGTAASYKKTHFFPLKEEDPLGDWSIWGDYNKGKVACEKILRTSGITFAAIRPVYILGQHNYMDREHFIYSRIKKGIPLTLPGNGQALLQFVFAEDVAESIVLLAEKKMAGAFNCASDEIITLSGLVEEMGSIMRLKPKITFNHDADGDRFNEAEFPFANETFFCNNDKLKSLGIKFKPLIKGLEEDYKNYYKAVLT